MSASELFDTNLLKALGHPLRLRIVSAITERGEASPVSLAREFKQPLATVSRHTRVLRDLGWIELARTEQRRGAIEHFYRSVTRPFIDDDEWEQLPVPMRRGLAGQTLRAILQQAARAGGVGGFDDVGACVARMPLELDERGWRELSDAMTGLLREAEAIQLRCDARRSDDSGPLRESDLAILHFRVAEPVSPSERGSEARRARRPRLP
jgi:DNA-binding transcriptional ArsR family regulator